MAMRCSSTSEDAAVATESWTPPSTATHRELNPHTSRLNCHTAAPGSMARCNAQRAKQGLYWLVGT